MKRNSNYSYLAALIDDIDKQTAVSPTYAHFNEHKIRDFQISNKKAIAVFQKFTSDLLEKYAVKDEKGKVAYPLVNGQPQIGFINGEEGQKAFTEAYHGFLSQPVVIVI